MLKSLPVHANLLAGKAFGRVGGGLMGERGGPGIRQGHDTFVAGAQICACEIIFRVVLKLRAQGMLQLIMQK